MAADEHALHPFIHSLSHHRSPASLLRPVSFPDVLPRKTDLTLHQGNFLTLFPERGTHDAVVVRPLSLSFAPLSRPEGKALTLATPTALPPRRSSSSTQPTTCSTISTRSSSRSSRAAGGSTRARCCGSARVRPPSPPSPWFLCQLDGQD